MRSSVVGAVFRLLLCAFFLLILGFVLFWLCRKMGPKPMDYLVFLPAHQADNEHDPRVIVQEIICPKGADYCFKVEDYVMEEMGQGRETRRRYQRRLMVESQGDVVLSVVDLLPNPEDRFTAQNALHWPIQKTKLSLAYTKGIVGQMVANGCVGIGTEGTGRRRRTLMVGLGGGAIPNILAEMDPKHEIVSVELEPAIEYIARKWFGLEESERQRVLIRDGVDYVQREWTEADGRFDCVIIDACQPHTPDPDQKYPLMCPVAEFVNHEQIVKRMFQMLRAKGTLLINTFVTETDANRDKVAEMRQFLLELFRHHFGHCYYAALPFNKLLVCSLALSDKVPMTNDLYENRMKELPKWLGEELEMTVEGEVWRAKSEF